MKITVLGSGSKGNSTLIETASYNILIDAGLTLKNIETRLNKPLPKIDAIIITHTHSDHTKGLKALMKKYKPIIYTQTEELKTMFLYDNINYEKKINIKGIEIDLFDLSHDVPCSGVLIKEDNQELVYITDTGYISRKVINKIVNKNIYIMESNHDVELLRNSTYPFYLQQRIMGDKGHLSNKDANKYLKKLIGKNTKYIVLAHLSEENNNEKLAYEEEKELLENNQQIEKLYIAKQEQILETIEV